MYILIYVNNIYNYLEDKKTVLKSVDKEIYFTYVKKETEKKDKIASL